MDQIREFTLLHSETLYQTYQLLLLGTIIDQRVSTGMEPKLLSQVWKIAGERILNAKRIYLLSIMYSFSSAVLQLAAFVL